MTRIGGGGTRVNSKSLYSRPVVNGSTRSNATRKIANSRGQPMGWSSNSKTKNSGHGSPMYHDAQLNEHQYYGMRQHSDQNNCIIL